MGSPNRRPEYSEPEKTSKGPRLHEPKEVEPRRSREFERAMMWIAAGFTVLPLLIAAVVAILLSSPSFHRYLKSTLERQVSESLGVQLNLEGFALHVSSLSVDLYGVTIHGAAPYQNPPLLQVQHLTAGIGITSILQRKWYFRNIEIDRPIVQVLVDAQGVSNLPKPKTNGSKSNTS